MKSSADYEKEFINSILEKTGKSLNAWMNEIKQTSLSKTKEITKWAKMQKLNHMQATFLAGIYLNDGKATLADTSALENKLFATKEEWKPVFEKLKKELKETIPEVSITSTKTYLEFKGKKLFAMAKIMKSMVRVGMDLGELPFDKYVMKGKGLGAMPRISHMVEVKSIDDINSKILQYLQLAYTRVHPK